MARRGFSVLELLVVISIISLLISLLLPVFANARERGRFIKWAGYSQNLRNDQDITLYFNFEQQNGTETNAFNRAVVRNRAAGNAMQLAKGRAIEPQKRDGLIDGPTWSFDQGRWPGKGVMRFDGVNDRVELNHSYAKGGGKFITVAAWVRGGNSLENQAICSFDASEVFQLSLRQGADLPAWQTTDSAGLQHTQNGPKSLTDNQWHFIVGLYTVQPPNAVKQLFIDGQLLDGGNPHIDKPLGAGITRGATFGHLGASSLADTQGGATGGEYLDAYVDEFIIIEKRLELDALAEMYKVGKPRVKD